MGQIYDHTKIQYQNRWQMAGKNKYNGAYYYSQEIVNNIIPNVETDRSWMTVNIPRVGADHAVVFVHNNLDTTLYQWIKDTFNDVVMVCGVPETVEKIKAAGFEKAIYLPLSVDVKYVEQFKKDKKTKKIAFAGRPGKRSSKYNVDLPDGIDYLEGMPRGELLRRMADYEKVYAVGRTAIEALVLGCEVLPYDERFPDPARWEVLDNVDAARILQHELDNIDGAGKPIIIDHNREEYKQARDRIGVHRWNGAYYYSKEIVQNIIPLVKTDRSWITIKAGTAGRSHSICFVHNNIAFEKSYEYMKQFDDVVYVVGLPDMVERARALGKVIYLPLSVDVEYVRKFRTKKTKDTAFVGRPDIRPRVKEEYGVELPADIDFIEGLPRKELLTTMAQYRNVYAIGRTAIEAKVLGCNILSYHPRVPDPEMWQVLDNSEAAAMLQVELDRIDGKAEAEPEPEPEEIEAIETEDLDDPEDVTIIPTMKDTKKDMLAWCQENKVEGVTDKMTKAQIMEKIREAIA